MDANTKTAGQTALQVYSYQGSNVTFQRGENIMVNANEMAKPFGKRATHWLKNQSTKDFLQELSGVRNLTPSELVQVSNGNNGGTWMHEDVALEFARWLSPKFAIWCNDRIKELLTSGITTATTSQQSRDDDEVIAHAMQVLNNRLQQKEAELATAQQNLLALQERVDECEIHLYDNDELARYAFQVLFKGKTYTFSQLAPEFGYSKPTDLTNELCRLGILYRDSDNILHPTEPYAHHTWFLDRTYRRYDAHGHTIAKSYLVVTEMGRFMLHHRLNPDFTPDTLSQEGGAQ